MRTKATMLLAGLLLAGCESLPIPTSETDSPPAHAPVDLGCMQDCRADQADPELCRQRCAK